MGADVAVLGRPDFCVAWACARSSLYAGRRMASTPSVTCWGTSKAAAPAIVTALALVHQVAVWHIYAWAVVNGAV